MTNWGCGNERKETDELCCVEGTRKRTYTIIPVTQVNKVATSNRILISPGDLRVGTLLTFNKEYITCVPTKMNKHSFGEATFIYRIGF
ncbi:hypothetical protein RIVM261_041470 [Rivularia sp. IAM M-261]|nr:hypothetical protein RIVM261_041470 [Rivularia sp. IAM M-261]